MKQDIVRPVKRCHSARMPTKCCTPVLVQRKGIRPATAPGNRRAASGVPRQNEILFVEDIEDMTPLEIVNEHRLSLGRRPISEGPGQAFVEYVDEILPPPRSPSFASWSMASTYDLNPSEQSNEDFITRAKKVLRCFLCFGCTSTGKDSSCKVRRVRYVLSEVNDFMDNNSESSSFTSYYPSVNPISEKYSTPSDSLSGVLFSSSNESLRSFQSSGQKSREERRSRGTSSRFETRDQNTREVRRSSETTRNFQSSVQNTHEVRRSNETTRSFQSSVRITREVRRSSETFRSFLSRNPKTR